MTVGTDSHATSTTDGPNGGVTLLTGASALRSVEDSWKALEVANDLPVFQRFAWAETWLEHWGHSGEPWLLVAGTQPRAILPLFHTRRAGLRILTLIGHGISDYLGPICDSVDSAAELGAALGQLTRRVDLTVLRGVNPDVDVSVRFLAAIDTPLSSRLYERCPAISTQDGWQHFWQGRKSKFRANFKHMQRRVERLGKAVIRTETASPQLFDAMIDVERASWKWKEGLSFLRNPTFRAFLQDIVLQKRVPLEIWTCRIGGKLVGFAIVFRLEQAWHYYLPSYREDSWGSGLYLMAEIIKRCCELGLSEFDFLGGDEDYKKRWMTHAHRTDEVVIPGRLPFGPILAGASRARWLLARSQRLREVRRCLLVAWRRIRT